MHKTSSALLGALVVVATGVVIWKVGPRSPDVIIVPTMASEASAARSASPVVSQQVPKQDILDDPSFNGVKGLKPGFALLDGTKPPSVPPDAPQRVKFGVILIRYRGAQRAALTTRSKAEALALAKSIAELAETDFKAAVEKGDDGSTERAGWMPAGILEPAPNFVLLTTPAGQVRGPVDTPTGYWIVKNTSKPKRKAQNKPKK